MTVQELAELIGAEVLCGDAASRQVKFGYSCDLLSWVMSHGAADTAWITVMTHMNAIAVATLLDLACIVAPEGIAVAEPVLEKAREEGVCLLACGKTAYEISGLLYAKGIGAPSRG